jgi:hypothetical protein
MVALWTVVLIYSVETGLVQTGPWGGLAHSASHPRSRLFKIAHLVKIAD